MTIGEYIKHLRDVEGWSLSELSRRSGVAKGYLSEVERGNSDPSLNILQSVAKAFDMDAGDLLVDAGYTVHPERVMKHYTLTTRVTVLPDGRIATEFESLGEG